MSNETQVQDYALRHRRFGWWMLLLFLTTGIALEAMHAFKVDLYLNVENDTRRLMWSLGHAHGTLLALVNLAFAAVGATAWPTPTRGLRAVSACMMSANLLLPGGFFLGGIVIYGGDPGLAILLVPVGSVLLLIAVLATARRATWKD